MRQGLILVTVLIGAGIGLGVSSYDKVDVKIINSNNGLVR
jgi:hypothetical protein